MIIGALIIMFLIVEPHGLARFWAIITGKADHVAFPALKEHSSNPNGKVEEMT